MEDLLQCPICYINYNHQERTPRQLNNCQHILCSECLPHLVKPATRTQGSFIECPICKDKLFTSVTNVPRSLVIMQVMDATRGSKNSNTLSKRESDPPSYSSVSNVNTSQPFPNQRSPPISPQTSEKATNNPYNWKPTNPFHSDLVNNNSQPQYPRQQQQSAPVLNPYTPMPVPQSQYPKQQQQNPVFNPYTSVPQAKPPSNPYYSQPVPSTNSIESWDLKRFLRNLFNQIDANHDGKITGIELQEALRRGQGVSDFNIKTIHLLVSKYDKNGDREISFDEFYDLYCNLNDEYENFLMMDQDGSGYIDLDEFQGAMEKKEYKFSRKFFKFVVEEIGKHTSSGGIKFDNYIRVMARFDYLCSYYYKTPYFHTKHSLESYLKNTFFQDFW